MEKNHRTTEASKLVGPLPISNFKQQLKDGLERIYASNKQAPLGRGPEPDIPLRVRSMRFGFISEKGDSVGDLMSPCITSAPINFYLSKYSEDYDPSKQYLQEMDPAGVKYNYDKFGDQMEEIFTIHSPAESDKILPMYIRSQDRKLDQDSNEEKMTDDILLSPKYIVMGKDKTYSFLDPVKVQPKRFMKEEHLVEVLWNMIKMKNHCNFEDFKSAFEAYDENNVGKITADDVQLMCQKFGVSVPIRIIKKLIEKCDILDHDGAINYQEFAHCLNWKDMLPQNVNQKDQQFSDWRQGINNPPEDIIDHYKTVTSFIGDYYFKDPLRTAGTPTSRTDKIQPRCKRISDYCTYDNDVHAASLIQPNIFEKYGVYEQDLAQPMSKQKMTKLFKKSGLLIDDEEFDKLWRCICKNGKASVGAVMHALRQRCF